MPTSEKGNWGTGSATPSTNATTRTVMENLFEKKTRRKWKEEGESRKREEEETEYKKKTKKTREPLECRFLNMFFHYAARGRN